MLKSTIGESCAISVLKQLEISFTSVEVWRAVVDFENLYEVSDWARVKSLGRYVYAGSGRDRWNHERIMKPCLNSIGYPTVNLYRDGVAKSHKVHRLVAQAVLADYSNDLQVDHIDGDKTNNAPSNLRMATSAENHRAYKRKLKGCSSRFRGVSWDKQYGKWLAQIRFNGKKIHLGRFHDEIEAARAYNTRALELGFFQEALNMTE